MICLSARLQKWQHGETSLDPHLNFDAKFRKRPLRYLLQCAIAGLVAMAMLSGLGLLTYTGMVAALGATIFVTFTMPHRVSSRPRYLIGGYIMGTVAGLICNYAFIRPDAWLPSPGVFFLGAIAVGTASLLMVATNTEHPPAAGFALGLVLQPWDYKTLVYVLACVCVLSIIRLALKRYLIDLL
jgi:CBS-domain-containing membrane protein